MAGRSLKDKILTKLYAAHLTSKQRYGDSPRGRFSGERVVDLAQIFSLEVDEVLKSAKELEQEGLVVFNDSNSEIISISGLGIQRMDFSEKIEQLKSTVMIERVAEIMEKELKGIDPKDKAHWKKRLLDAAQTILTKTAEIAIGAVIKS